MHISLSLTLATEAVPKIPKRVVIRILLRATITRIRRSIKSKCLLLSGNSCKGCYRRIAILLSRSFSRYYTSNADARRYSHQNKWDIKSVYWRKGGWRSEGREGKSSGLRSGSTHWGEWHGRGGKRFQGRSYLLSVATRRRPFLRFPGTADQRAQVNVIGYQLCNCYVSHRYLRAHTWRTLSCRFR